MDGRELTVNEHLGQRETTSIISRALPEHPMTASRSQGTAVEVEGLFVCLFEFWFLGLFVCLPACSWGRVSLCNFRWPGHNNVDQALTCRFQPGFGFASASLMLGLKDYCDWPVYLLTLVSFLIFLPSSFFF